MQIKLIGEKCLKISSSNVDLQLERDNALEKIPKEALDTIQTKTVFNL